MNPFESVDLWLINLATVRVVHISNEGPLVRGQESRRGTDLLISPLPKIGFTDVIESNLCSLCVLPSHYFLSELSEDFSAAVTSSPQSSHPVMLGEEHLVMTKSKH